MPEPVAPRLIASEVVYRGRLFNVAVDEIEMAGGVRARREIIRHPGAVGMLAMEDDGRLLMVTQYRHAIGRRQLEIPAGTLEPGEERLAAVARELQEEVGMRPGMIKPFGGLVVAGGYTSEYIALYLCTELVESRLPGDEDEDIEVERHHLGELLEMVDRGEIEDSKTVIGLLRLQRRINQ